MVLIGANRIKMSKIISHVIGQMYVVRRGKLNVVSDDGTKVFATLSAGTVFGELSILNIPGSKHGNRRTANVCAVGYADLFSLSKEDLWDSLEEYPQVKENLLNKASHILHRDGLIDDQVAEQSRRLARDWASVTASIEVGLENLSLHMHKFLHEYFESVSVLNKELAELETSMHGDFRRGHKRSFRRSRDTRRLRSAGDNFLDAAGEYPLLDVLNTSQLDLTRQHNLPGTPAP